MASLENHLVHSPRAFGGRLGSVCKHRSFRVVVLALAIALMSGVDLYLTLLYITHTGMNELNPLARAMMDYQSPAILAVWKGGTVAISLGILILIRRQRSAELGAWIGFVLMGSLMIHWQGYIETSNGLNLEMAKAQNQENPSWIIMPRDATGVNQPVLWIID